MDADFRQLNAKNGERAFSACVSLTQRRRADVREKTNNIENVCKSI
jgi:hypothetical protein